MDQAIKEIWVSDLRSGKYKQGKGFLRDDNRDHEDEFCCLGVLCEQAVRAGVISRFVKPILNLDGSTYPRYYYGVEGDARYEALPDAVVRWAGLDSNDPTVPVPVYSNDRSPGHLSEHNDTDTLFPEIADMIDEHL